MKESAAKLQYKSPNILILEAGKDELVPSSHGDMIYQRCIDIGLDVRKKVVGNALHTEVMVRPEGRLAVVEAIRNVALE
jgi:predicted esterase